MSISPTTALSKPEGANKVSLGTLGYVRARNRQRAYNLVVKEFKKSGITQADLARRLGKAAEVVSRLLSRPRNWELDTFSDLLFAISGAVPAFSVDHPLAAQKGSLAYARIDPQRPQTGSERAPIPTMNVKSNNPAIKIVEFPRAA